MANTNPFYLFELAASLLKEGRVDECLHICDALHQRFPTEPATLQLMTQAYLALDMPLQASAVIEQCLSLEPNNMASLELALRTDYEIKSPRLFYRADVLLRNGRAVNDIFPRIIALKELRREPFVDLLLRLRTLHSNTEILEICRQSRAIVSADYAWLRCSLTDGTYRGWSLQDVTKAIKILRCRKGRLAHLQLAKIAVVHSSAVALHDQTKDDPLEDNSFSSLILALPHEDQVDHIFAWIRKLGSNRRHLPESFQRALCDSNRWLLEGYTNLWTERANVGMLPPPPVEKVATLRQAASMLRISGKYGDLTNVRLLIGRLEELGASDLIKNELAAIAHLELGELPTAWQHYAHRSNEQINVMRRVSSQRLIPESVGEMRHREIKLILEQGLGDQLMMAKAAMHCELKPSAVYTSPRLVKLVKKLTGWQNVLDFKSLRIQGTDFYLMGGDLLKFVLKPNDVRITRIEPISIREDTIKIGLAWKSRNSTEWLQKNVEVSEILNTLPSDATVTVLQENLTEQEADTLSGADFDVYYPTFDCENDFVEMLDKMKSLDLIVTTSNTLAHLAAAFDLRVLVIIPNANHALWYWSLYESLYPSVELIKGKNWQDKLRKLLRDKR